MSFRVSKRCNSTVAQNLSDIARELGFWTQKCTFYHCFTIFVSFLKIISGIWPILFAQNFQTEILVAQNNLLLESLMSLSFSGAFWHSEFFFSQYKLKFCTDCRLDLVSKALHCFQWYHNVGPTCPLLPWSLAWRSYTLMLSGSCRLQHRWPPYVATPLLHSSLMWQWDITPVW